MKLKIVKIAIVISALSFYLLSTGCTGVQRNPIGFSGVECHDGILYIGTTDGRVVAVNPDSRVAGQEFPSSDREWSYSPILPSKGFSCSSSPAPVSIYGTPVVTDGLICVGIYNGKVLMMSPSARDGDSAFPQLKEGEWSYPRTDDVIEPIVGRPVVIGNVVYTCCSDGRVYALDRNYGDEVWKSEPLDDKLWISPLIKEGTLYISTFDGYIYALSADDGDLLPWSFKAEAGFVSSAALYQDIIYVGSFDRNLYAVRIGDDAPLWKFSAGNWFWSTPLIENGVVYAGCLDGKVYALNAVTGDKLWEFEARDSVVSSPILADDLVIIASESGNIYLINKLTGAGERIKNFEEPGNENITTTGALIRSSLCSDGGTLYVHTQNDVVYAIDIESGKLSWKFSLINEEDN